VSQRTFTVFFRANERADEHGIERPVPDRSAHPAADHRGPADLPVASRPNS
jgi:hypothetical protein